MLALQETSHEYPLDLNGVPIKPGYRKPFTSETARQAGLTTAQRNREARQRLQLLPGPIDPPRRSKRGVRQLIKAIRASIIRHCEASAQSIDNPDKAMRHAQLVKLMVGIESSLYDNPKRSKPHSIPSAPSSFPMPDSGSKPPMQYTTPPNQDTSGVKSDDKVSPVSPV